MQKSSFKFAAIFALFFFLATPTLVFAQGCAGGNCGGSNGGGGGQGSGVFGGAFGGGGGGGGGSSALELVALTSLMQGGASGGGGGIGQLLTLLGAATGNKIFLIAGLIMSMLGGLGGGGDTPQEGNVDEGYVGQGQGFGSGGGGNPYYPTPTPNASVAPQASACTASVFIVKDTTITPNVTKPYPASSSIAQNSCILAINSDTTSHSVEVKQQGQATASATQSVGASASHIFRFATKNTYTLCLDGSASACTTVTVQ